MLFIGPATEHSERLRRQIVEPIIRGDDFIGYRAKKALPKQSLSLSCIAAEAMQRAFRAVRSLPAAIAGGSHPHEQM